MHLARRLLAAALFLAVTAPADAAVRPGNLLVNPGAEADSGSTDASCGGNVEISGWAETSTFTAVRYGTGNFLSLAQASSYGGGRNHFTGGCGSGPATAAQIVDVSGGAADVDAGKAVVSLSALLGGYSSQTDSATVQVYFESATGADLGAVGPDLAIGPVTPADRRNLTSLAGRSASASPPRGTRRVRVLITIGNKRGSSADGYADNLSLTFTGPGSAPDVNRSFVAAPASGKVTVKCPGRARANLKDVRELSLRCAIDATNGRVDITSAADARGRIQTARFSLGAFVVSQRTERGRPVTQLALTGARPSCPSATGTASARNRRKRRRLFGSGAGRFRTRGAYGSATVRGTRWLTEDRCDGTFFRVSQGVVAVQAFRLGRTVTVRAGRSFLAPARR